SSPAATPRADRFHDREPTFTPCEQPFVGRCRTWLKRDGFRPYPAGMPTATKRVMNRALYLFVLPFAVTLAGCPKERELTSAEAQEALQEASASSQAENL